MTVGQAGNDSKASQIMTAGSSLAMTAGQARLFSMGEYYGQAAAGR